MNRILFGILFTLMLCAGCVQHRLLENTRVPEIEISDAGNVVFQGKIVKPSEVAEALADAGIPKTQEINILITANSDRRLMTYLIVQLDQAGYKRTIFISRRRTYSEVKKYTGSPIPEPKAVKY